MIIDPFKLPRRDAYQLLIGSVVPRPIAWVSTVAADGSHNLAPFSYFMAVTESPPTLAISCNWRRRPFSKKDTLSNVEATGELVINLVTEETAQAMNSTSAEFGPETDEFVQAGLTPAASQLVRPPRVAEAPVNIECRLNRIIYVGNEGQSAGLILAEALLWHVRDDLLTPQLTIDVTKLLAIGRLNYNLYTRTRDQFEMVRPTL